MKRHLNSSSHWENARRVPTELSLAEVAGLLPPKFPPPPKPTKRWWQLITKYYLVMFASILLVFIAVLLPFNAVADHHGGALPQVATRSTPNVSEDTQRVVAPNRAKTIPIPVRTKVPDSAPHKLEILEKTATREAKITIERMPEASGNLAGAASEIPFEVDSVVNEAIEEEYAAVVPEGDTAIRVPKGNQPDQFVTTEPASTEESTAASLALVPNEDTEQYTRPENWGNLCPEMAVQSKDLPPFRKLVVRGNVRVVVRRAVRNHATIITAADATDQLDINLRNGVLTLAHKQQPDWQSCTIDVQLSARDLSRLVSRGKSCIYFDNELGSVHSRGGLCKTINFNDWIEVEQE